MYTRDRPDFRFTFSIRHPSGLVVVSRARMDPRLLGLMPYPALRMRRLQKMVMLLTRFARAVRADRAKLASLRARWSEAVLARWVKEGLRASLALKSNSLELGSLDCARYFDPATYAS